MSVNAEATKVLLRAAEILEQGWCKGNLACTKEGLSVETFSEKAEQWCLLGSFFAAMQQLGYADVANDWTGDVRQVIRKKISATTLKLAESKSIPMSAISTMSLAGINDLILQSQDEAVEFMRSAAFA